MKHTIAVVEDVWGTSFDELARHYHVIHEPDAWADPEQIRELMGNASVLVVRNKMQVTQELLDSAPKLQVVARAGVGLDNINIAAADSAGVVVVAALGVNATSVAEHTIGLALSIARNVIPLDRDVRAGNWNRTPGRELSGGTWGLLSAGRTARATGSLAKSLGMKVIAYDPYVPADDPELRELGIQIAELDEVAACADVLSVHLPATSDTHNIVDGRLLSLMKEEAILVNTGRGEAIDELALADALSKGRLRGAGLDVRVEEPPGADDKFADLRNVVLTPHIAGITVESQAKIADALCEDITAVLGGFPAGRSVGARLTPDRGQL